jgi:hypothetical protein
MEVVQIKRQKSLSKILRDLPCDTWASIKHSSYKTQSVRTAISRLRMRGFDFECTEKDCPDYIKVRRIK